MTSARLLAAHADEEGAEFFHGGGASAHALAQAAELSTARVFTAAHGDGGPDTAPAPDGGYALYWLGKDGPCLPYDAAHSGFQRLNEVLGGLSDVQVAASDERSVEDHLRDRGVPAALLPLAQASYANTLGAGAGLARLPLAAVVALERRWLADGEDDYRLLGRAWALPTLPGSSPHSRSDYRHHPPCTQFLRPALRSAEPAVRRAGRGRRGEDLLARGPAGAVLRGGPRRW